MVRKYTNTRSSELREELRSLVVQSRPGTKLPSENALVSKYHVARMTAGKALRELEAEGLIERRRGCGTFVKGKRVITFLLPCPEFLDERYTQYNRLTISYLQGALQAVTERGMTLEMRSASRTNNCDEINYSLLADLNAGSMVICTMWFHLLYSFLVNQEVRVAFLGQQHEFYGYRQYHPYFYNIEADRKNALIQILDWYHHCGKRRIALAGGYLHIKDHPLRTAYQEWCQSRNMPELLYTAPELDSQSAAYPEGYLAGLHRQDAFDAIVIHHLGFPGAQGSIQEYLGIPPEVAVFGFEYDLLNSPRLNPFPVCLPKARQMAYEAVAALDEMRPRGSTLNFPYEFQHLPADWQEYSENCQTMKQHFFQTTNNTQTKE